MLIKLSDINIEVSDNESRTEILQDDCKELAASLKIHGQLLPVLVEDLPGGGYKLISGFRRYTAASMLNWETIKAEYVPTDVEYPGMANAIENIHRENLTFWDECVALKNMGCRVCSISSVAESLGKSRTWCRPRCGLWELDFETQEMVRLGQLTASDITAILSHSEEERTALASSLSKAAQEGVSAHERTQRKTVRSKKEVQRLLTVLFDTERADWIAILRYVLGDIDDEKLHNTLDAWKEL